MGQEVKYIVVNPGEMPGDNDLAFAAKVYSGYGGITVKEVRVSTGAVGTFDVILMKRGSAGTVNGGTVGSMASGTATVWAADTPQSLTLTAAQAFCDEGEHLFIKKHESAGSQDFTNDAAVCIAYVDGIVSDS